MEGRRIGEARAEFAPSDRQIAIGLKDREPCMGIAEIQTAIAAGILRVGEESRKARGMSDLRGSPPIGSPQPHGPVDPRPSFLELARDGLLWNVSSLLI
jgi:hypothetical protein